MPAPRGETSRAGERGPTALGPCDAGPPRTRARRPICPEDQVTFTDPVAPDPADEGAPAREPWVLPLLPRSSAPCSPERTSSAPRGSPHQHHRIHQRPLARPPHHPRIATPAASHPPTPARPPHRTPPHDLSSRATSSAPRPAGPRRRPPGGQGPVDTGSSGRTQGSRAAAPSSLRCESTASVKARRASRPMGRRARALGGPASQGPAVRRPPSPGPCTRAPRSPLTPSAHEPHASP